MRKLCLVLLSMAALLGCKHTAEESQTKIEEPLLLLDEGPASADDADMVDNQRCHVCHGNFMFEDFSVTHAKGDVGCETCHGSSDAHCDDEDHVIPPDRFFAKTEINALCLECHDREALDTKRASPPFRGKGA